MATAQKKSAKRRKWGFDTSELSDMVRPQDDFYKYVNEKWCKANPIPASESRWGSFIMLRYKTDQQMHAILKELDAKRSVPTGSAEQIIRDFYRSGMDMDRRNKLDIKPLAEWREKIQSITSQKQLLGIVAQLHRVGVGVLWGGMIDQDSKNSERYMLHFVQDGLGMPDRDYYLKDDPESVRVRNAYTAHVTKMFTLMGRKPLEAKTQAEAFLKLEAKLAKASMKKEDLRDPEKTYHKFTLAKLQKHAPAIDWARYLALTEGKNVKDMIVMQPEFFAAVSGLLESESLEDWKNYLEWHLVSDFSSLLSARFIRETFAFYGTVLTGTKKMRPLWRRVLNNVNGHLGELLGQIYVKKHFTPEAKKRMDILVDDLFIAYNARLRSLDWMTPVTKKKALQKLHALTRKIGYPDKWKSYKGLEIKPSDYVGNVIRTNIFEHKRAMKKLQKPIERWEWFMYPQTVNAYFAPNMNDIVFPAAILQPPFFSMDSDDALNYGCIGAVIGHEITHGFDDEGSKFDAKGNLKSWWTDEDRKRFEAKAGKVEKQFDAYKVADDVPVNGKLTLGENIADAGGLSIAFDAYKLQLERTGRTDIDGFTPEQRFFLGFALFERENVRPEFEKMAVLTDPHSPGKFRINGPLTNMPQFYAAWNVQKDDGMYTESDKRAEVW